MYRRRLAVCLPLPRKRRLRTTTRSAYAFLVGSGCLACTSVRHPQTMVAIEKKRETQHPFDHRSSVSNVSPHQRADVSYGVFPCETLNLLLHHSFIFNLNFVLNLRRRGIN